MVFERLVLLIHDILHPIRDNLLNRWQLWNLLLIKSLKFNLLEGVFDHLIGPVILGPLIIDHLKGIEQQRPLKPINLPMEGPLPNPRVMEALHKAHNLIRHIGVVPHQIGLSEVVAEQGLLVIADEVPVVG